MDPDHIPGAPYDSGISDSGGRASQRNAQQTEETPSVEGSQDSTGASDYTDSGITGDGENGNGEEAVTEIWSGNEPELADFIAASLQINQIQFRHDRSGGKHTLYVPVDEETRAREIVREVVEGVPPE
jgi:hypothetical protein